MEKLDKAPKETRRKKRKIRTSCAHARLGDMSGKDHTLPRLSAEDLKSYLKSIYFNSEHPAGYAGALAVYNAVKSEGKYNVTFKQIEEWLADQDAYATFKSAKKKFQRPRVIVSDKDQQWDADTLNMSYYKDSNDGYAYILVCIDVFTRYLFTRPLRNLRGIKIKESLEDIFKYNEPPKSIRTDRGSEFVNTQVREYLQSKNINHFLTNNEIKTSHAERVIRTIRLRIARMMKARHDFNWVKHLQSITSAYNLSKHRSINCSPLEAMCTVPKSKLWHWQYLRNDAATKTGPNSFYKFHLTDRVRVSYLATTFDRAYDERWSKVIYTITGRRMDQGFQKYKLKSWNNDPVFGEFYKEELQKVAGVEDAEYEIERVMKQRMVGPRNARRREILVKWMGWPETYNSWIPEEDLVELQPS